MSATLCAFRAMIVYHFCYSPVLLFRREQFYRLCFIILMGSSLILHLKTYLMHCYNEIINYNCFFFLASSCRDPGTPLNGHKSSTNYNHGSTITFSCKAGFSLQGSASRTCSRGQWSGTRAECKGTNYKALKEQGLIHWAVQIKYQHRFFVCEPRGGVERQFPKS